MNKQETEKLAKQAVETVQVDDPIPVSDFTVLWLNEDGTYSVTDNGEEVSGLDEEGAIRVITENLLALSEEDE